MKVMFKPIATGVLGTVTKLYPQGLDDLEISGRVETIQTTTLLGFGRILRRILNTWGDLQSLKLQSLKTDVKKNSQGVNNDNTWINIWSFK